MDTDIMDKISKVSDKSRKNLTGGSRKGVPNKSTKELKEMILQALDGAGGVSYLLQRANDPKTAGAFLSLIGKVLPMTVVGEKDQPLVFNLIERRIVQAGT